MLTTVMPGAMIRSGIVGLCMTGALTLSLLTSGAAPAVADPMVTVSVPGPLTTGTAITVSATLSGASAKDLERGIAWRALEPTVSVNGWAVRVGYGLPGAVGTTTLQSNRGLTATFVLTPRFNGHYRFVIETGDPDTAAAAPPAVAEVDVASPQLPSLPAAPANPRLEISQTPLPASGSVAYFQSRMVADSPLAAPATVAQGMWTTSVSIGDSGYVPLIPGTGASPWVEASQRWISSGEPPEVAIKYEGPDLYVLHRADLAYPLTFAAEGIYAVYPPETAMRCTTRKRTLTCHLAVYNAGVRSGASPPVPAVVPTLVQLRYKVPGSKSFTKWVRLASGELPMNGPASILSKRLRGAAATAVQQIKLTVIGFPDSSVIVSPQNVADIETLKYTVSNLQVLE